MTFFFLLKRVGRVLGKGANRVWDGDGDIRETEDGGQ